MQSVNKAPAQLEIMRAPQSIVALNKDVMRGRKDIEAARQELWALRKLWFKPWAGRVQGAAVSTEAVIKEHSWVDGTSIRPSAPLLSHTSAERALPRYQGWLSYLHIVDIQDENPLLYGDDYKKNYTGPVIAARIERPLSNPFNTLIVFAAVSLPDASLTKHIVTDFELLPDSRLIRASS